MTDATVRADLFAIINAVTDVGNVYDYQKWSLFWADIVADFVTEIGGSDVIRAWTISLQSLDPSLYQWQRDGTSTAGAAVLLREYTWKIRGFFSHDDANTSEKTIATLIRTVMNALDTSPVLHDGDQYHMGPENEVPPAVLDTFDLRIFGGVLCHYAEITQRVGEYLAIEV